MKALAVSDGGARLVDLPWPEPDPGEALVRVRLAGICNTDLELARGYLGFRGVLGHEVLGTVVSAAPDTPLPDGLLGKRVALEINCACERCATCRDGGRNHCPERTVLGILGRNGGIAEAVAIPIRNLKPIPDSISDEAAIFIEPLAAALHAFDAVAVRPGDRVALLGDGKLGLLIGLGLALRRGDLARAVVIGRHRAKLALLEAKGLEARLDSAGPGGGAGALLRGRVRGQVRRAQ